MEETKYTGSITFKQLLYRGSAVPEGGLYLSGKAGQVEEI